MATVTKPIALDESIKTTESTSRNIADVLAQELSGIASAITGGSDKANKTDIATVEPTNTASRAYSVGELVYVNGNLYKVITAIASGATFTVGTNIQSANVSGTVKDALDDLSTDGNVVTLLWGESRTIARDRSKAYVIMSARDNSGSIAYVAPWVNERIVISASTPTIARVRVTENSITITATSTGGGTGAWVTILSFNVPQI